MVRQPRDQCLETTSIRFHHESVCTDKVMSCFHLILAGTQESWRTETVSFTKLAVGSRLIQVVRQAFSQKTVTRL